MPLTMFLAFATLVNTSHAATRTACYWVKFKDKRNGCADVSEDGARNGCDNGASRDAVGLWVEIWDYDSSNSDEYIGTWRIGGGGRRCATFEWENCSGNCDKGETHPDPYIKLVNTIQGSASGSIEAVDEDGHAHVDLTGIARYYSNCTTGANCYIAGTDILVPSNDESSLTAHRYMALDSARHALDVYGAQISEDIEMRYPVYDDADYSWASSQHRIDVDNGNGNDGDNLTHEMGHVLQMQLFNHDDLTSDCGTNSAHSISSTTLEHESCATTEGWADYVAAVSWWDPNNLDSDPYVSGESIENPTGGPVNFMPCADEGHTELAVARSFWDLDDVHEDVRTLVGYTTEDEIALTTTSISAVWAQFPNGNNNREDKESDADGVNRWDWQYHAESYYPSSLEPYLELNMYHTCVDGQTLF